MSSQEWLTKLKSDQINRDGLGMLVLDTFNEQVAEILAKHDAKIRADAIQPFNELYKSNICIDHDIPTMSMLMNFYNQFKEILKERQDD